ATLIDRKTVGAVPLDEEQRDQLISQFRSRASATFITAYSEAAGARAGPGERALLTLFLIEKAAYEISYEAANRPSWIGVPVAGLSSLLTRITDKAARVRHE